MAVGAIVGGIIGGALGTYKEYSDYKANKDRERLARQQAEAAKRAAQDEEQARNKADKRGPDISGLLADNTAGGLGSTNLTGTKGAPLDPSRLGKGNSLLGG